MPKNALRTNTLFSLQKLMTTTTLFKSNTYIKSRFQRSIKEGSKAFKPACDTNEMMSWKRFVVQIKDCHSFSHTFVVMMRDNKMRDNKMRNNKSTTQIICHTTCYLRRLKEYDSSSIIIIMMHIPCLNVSLLRETHRRSSCVTVMLEWHKNKRKHKEQEEQIHIFNTQFGLFIHSVSLDKEIRQRN